MSSKVLYSIAGGLFLIVLVVLGFVFKDSLNSVVHEKETTTLEQSTAINDPASMDGMDYACRILIDEEVHNYNLSELERVGTSGEKPKLKRNVYDESVECPNGDNNVVYQFESGSYSKSKYIGDENSYFTLGDDATYANVTVNGKNYEVSSGEQVKVTLKEGDEITIESDGSIIYFGEYQEPSFIDPISGSEIMTSEGGTVKITE